MKQLINNLTTDILKADDYLYGYIIPVSSDFRRRQTILEEGPTDLRGGPNHPRSGRANRTKPKSGPRGGPVRKRADSHFKDNPWHRVWSQPGVPGESPRFCGEFNLLRKAKVHTAQDILREASCRVKIKTFLCHRDTRGCRTPSLQAKNRCC